MRFKEAKRILHDDAADRGTKNGQPRRDAFQAGRTWLADYLIHGARCPQQGDTQREQPRTVPSAPWCVTPFRQPVTPRILSVTGWTGIRRLDVRWR